MTKIFTSFVLLLISCASYAQGTISNGFYRVQNAGTGNYISMIHDKCYDMSTNVDLKSLQLFSASDRNLTSDPGAVIYVEYQYGSGSEEYYDLAGQGTSVKTFTGQSIKLAGNFSRGFTVSAKKSGATAYLYDSKIKNFDHSDMTTSGSANYMLWKPYAVSSSDDNTYFGITPSVTVGTKYYFPFYASFAFKPASAGMKVYYVNKVDDKVAVLKEITDVVPASTPVIIECSSMNASDNRLDLFKDGGAIVSGNLLKGNYFCNDYREALTDFDKATMRVLDSQEGKLVLSTNESSLHSLNSVLKAEYEKTLKECDEFYELYEEYPIEISEYQKLKRLVGNRFLNANQAYLPCSEGTESTLTIMTEEEYKKYVGIEDITTSSDIVAKKYYTIDGRTASEMQNGITIIKMSDGSVKKVLR